MKYTETQNITAQHVVPIAPFLGMSEETCARVMTGGAAGAQGRGTGMTEPP